MANSTRSEAAVVIAAVSLALAGLVMPAAAQKQETVAGLGGAPGSGIGLDDQSTTLHR